VKRLFDAAFTLALLSLLAAGGRADEPAAGKSPTKTKKVEANDLTLNVPESWKQKRETREPRIAEFEVPASGDDKKTGEFAVFYFGKQGAGGVAANIERWVGQLDKEGRKVKIVSGEAAAGKYTLVDLTGAYNKSVGPPVAKKTQRLAGWRVINVVIETESGPYFLKLDGPEKTIAAVENDFRAAFGGKKESEKEVKQE